MNLNSNNTLNYKLSEIAIFRAIMPDSLQSPQGLSQEAFAHYEQGQEDQRLFKGLGRLELVRTQELLSRHLPSPPAVIFDVGGGSGIYACWLAQQGYEVHLIDVLPLHVEQARRASQAQPAHPPC